MIVVSVNQSTLNTGVGATPQEILITDLSTQIVATNTSRSSLYLLNTSNTADIWVSCDADAQVGKGILLGKRGGSMVMDSLAFSTGPVNGICPSTQVAIVSFQELSK